MSYQSITIMGNLGGDPEVKYLDTDRVVAKFSVAVTERWKGRDGNPVTHTEWFRCEAWNKTAKLVEAYLKKGHKVLIVGRKREELYEGKYYYKLMVDVVRFAESPNKAQNQEQSPGGGSGHQEGGSPQNGSQTAPQAQNQAPAQGSFDNAATGPDDLPF